MNNTFRNYTISDNSGQKFFGGDQSWYSSNTRAMAGCGPVAGSNFLRSLCLTDRSCYEIIRLNKTVPYPIKKSLLSLKCTKEEFIMLMTGVYDVMRAFEIFPLNKIYDRKERNAKFFKIVKPNTGRSSIGFIRGVIRYARKYNLFLKHNALSTAFCSKEDAIKFIDEGLEKTGSVVILTSYNKHSLKLYHPTMLPKLFSDPEGNAYPSCPCADSSMKCHFATITHRQGEDVMISTWGRAATVSLDELTKSWHSIKAWESTLFYFTPTDKSGARHSLLTSWIPFVKGIAQALIRKTID